ncbi:hypothetical protein LTR12_011002 [Friedmanniomyces endolithicus]|nr:hypothetical protein LTR12_011002 [Friedmanniomyces endolithicus]
MSNINSVALTEPQDLGLDPSTRTDMITASPATTLSNGASNVVDPTGADETIDLTGGDDNHVQAPEPGHRETIDLTGGDDNHVQAPEPGPCETIDLTGDDDNCVQAPEPGRGQGPIELNQDEVLVFRATQLPVSKCRILEVAFVTLTTVQGTPHRARLGVRYVQHGVSPVTMKWCFLGLEMESLLNNQHARNWVPADDTAPNDPYHAGCRGMVYLPQYQTSSNGGGVTTQAARLTTFRNHYDAEFRGAVSGQVLYDTR